MIIDFEKIIRKSIPNFKGGEKQYDVSMYDDGTNKIMHGLLVPGASIGMHRHDDGSEIIFILSGVGTALTDDGEEIVEAGKCHYCPKGSAHSLVNRGDEDLIFYAVVAKQ